MSFLGKFFAGRATETQAKEGDQTTNQIDGPPQPKKQINGGEISQTTPQIVKKKFEKPVIKPRTDQEPETIPTDNKTKEISEEENKETIEIGNSLAEDHLSTSISHKPEIDQNSMTIQSQGNNPSKPLSFIEKMRLKKEQEEIQKRSLLQGTSVEENHQKVNSNDVSHNQETLSETKPKFAFNFKAKQNTITEEVSHDNPIDHNENPNDSDLKEHENNIHKETDKNATKNPPFKFLAKKKDQTASVLSQNEVKEETNRVDSQFDISQIHAQYGSLTENGSNINDNEGYQAVDNSRTEHKTTDEHSKPFTSKLKFGFLNKPKIKDENDTSINHLTSTGDLLQVDNPNENTLNLSPVDKDKSFNAQNDLADTLDRYDSGKHSPQSEKKPKIELAEFVEDN